MCLDVATTAPYVVLDPAAQAVEGLRHGHVRIVVTGIGRGRMASLDGAPMHRHAGMHVVAVAVPVVVLAGAHGDLACFDVGGETGQPLRALFDLRAQCGGSIHAVEENPGWNGREGHGIPLVPMGPIQGAGSMLTESHACALMHVKPTSFRPVCRWLDEDQHRGAAGTHAWFAL